MSCVLRVVVGSQHHLLAACFALLVALAGGATPPSRTALSTEDVVVVMHSGHPDRANYTNFAKRNWLRDMPRHVIVDGVRAGAGADDGMKTHRQLLHVFYDDNPGCPRLPCADGSPAPHYLMIGKYFGAHRTVAGVLVANDTWPSAKWVLVVDDDDLVDPNQIRKYLGELDADVPLFLAGRIGPGHNDIPCLGSKDVARAAAEMKNASATTREARDFGSNASSVPRWSCCTDASRPCPAYVGGAQAIWKYSDSARGFLPRQCKGDQVTNECCRTLPWPEGIHAGFPFRVAKDGWYRPHFAQLWPYGGLGYALSRGLLDAISRDHWQQCMYGIQCANADHRVMTCVLNAGFSLTRHANGIPGIRHHYRPPGVAPPPARPHRTRGGATNRGSSH